MKPFIEFVVQDDIHNPLFLRALQLGLLHRRYFTNWQRTETPMRCHSKSLIFELNMTRRSSNDLRSTDTRRLPASLITNFENVTQDVIGDEIETAGTARVMVHECERKNVGFRKVARFFSIYSGDKGFFSFEMRPAHTGYVSFYHRYDPYVLPVSPKTSAPHVQSVVHILQIRSAMMKTISAYQQPPPENDQECNKIYHGTQLLTIVSAGCSPVISSAQGNPEEIAKMNNL
ncbi:MAG: hypothetical protein J3Q66DRAFT_362334 [Benniella sp.]|nr:MAG: hypothetical protein J3Q66DRAFT_362334 [Benniella sp.]